MEASNITAPSPLFRQVNSILGLPPLATPISSPPSDPSGLSLAGPSGESSDAQPAEVAVAQLVNSSKLLGMIGALEGSTDPADFLAVNDMIVLLKRVAREFSQMAEAAQIDFVNRNGEVTVGDVRYYVGNVNSTKCNDNKAAVQALLTVTGGDADKLAECIASDGLKPGACRTVLADQFDAHFTTTAKSDLKTGKPTKALHRVDSRFVR